MHTLGRREFLWTAAQVALFTRLAGCADEAPKTAPSRVGPSPESTPVPAPLFSPERLHTLEAACDRLLPGIAGALPSARDLDVAQFFVQELQRPMFHQVGPFIVRGLGFLDASCMAEHQVHFAEATPEAQDALLYRYQQGDDTLKLPHFPAASFFELLLTLAMEGYFGHPSHGGNRGFGSWQALGIAWPR